MLSELNLANNNELILKKTWKTNGKKGTRNWAFPLKGYKKHYKGSFGEIFGAILNCLDKRYSEFSIKHFYK